jgi:hypothetical protein
MQDQRTHPAVKIGQTPKKEMTRRQQLEARPEHKITKAEKEELAQIIADEEAAHRLGAARHKLTEFTDKWARKTTSDITKAVSKEAGDLGKMRDLKIKKVNDSARDKEKDIRKAAKKAMTEIQNQLNVDLAANSKAQDKGVAEVNASYKPRFEELEKKMKNSKLDVEQSAAAFIEDIQILNYDQLTELANGKPALVEPTEENGKTKVISRPDIPKS